MVRKAATVANSAKEEKEEKVALFLNDNEEGDIKSSVVGAGQEEVGIHSDYHALRICGPMHESQGVNGVK